MEKQLPRDTTASCEAGFDVSGELTSFDIARSALGRVVGVPIRIIGKVKSGLTDLADQLSAGTGNTRL